MYTAETLGKSLSEKEKKIRVTVRFSDGAKTFDEDLEFGLDFTEAEFKRRVQRLINDYNAAALALSTLPATGVVNLTGVTQSTETQADIDKARWFKKVNKLRAYQELKALGGMPVAWEADLTALMTEVQNDARKAYLNDL